MNEKCENCRFWDSNADDGDDPSVPVTGDCLRYPPTTLQSVLSVRDKFSDESYRGIFPETMEYDWCGEWKAKDEAPV